MSYRSGCGRLGGAVFPLPLGQLFGCHGMAQEKSLEGIAAFLADFAVPGGELVMMAFDYPNGTLTVAVLPVVAFLLVGGWHLLRRPKAVMMTRRAVGDPDPEIPRVIRS